MKLYAKRHNNALHPTDKYSREALEKITGEVEIQVKQPRNIQFHRKFFAMLNVAFENRQAGEFGDLDVFRKTLLMQAGFYKIINAIGDKILIEAESISFANMDNQGFVEVYNKVLDIILNEYMPGIEKPEFEAEVEKILRFS
jgi:hypothetical protein